MRCVSESFVFAKLFNECPYHFEQRDYVSFSRTVSQSFPISQPPPHCLSFCTSSSIFSLSILLQIPPFRFSLFYKHCYPPKVTCTHIWEVGEVEVRGVVSN